MKFIKEDKMGFIKNEDLLKIGFRKMGNNVLISDKSSIYGASRIELGDNVRIDDFCILSAGDGGIEICDNVHIACYSSLLGNGKIKMCKFSGLSSRVSVYSSTDDYTGNYMTNPTVHKDFTNVMSGDVTLGEHVIIGAGSVILPNVNLAKGVAVGALSLVTRGFEEFTIIAGSPAKRIKDRSKKLLDLEWNFLKK